MQQELQRVQVLSIFYYFKVNMRRHRSAANPDATDGLAFGYSLPIPYGNVTQVGIVRDIAAAVVDVYVVAKACLQVAVDHGYDHTRARSKYFRAPGGGQVYAIVMIFSL